MNVHSTNDRGGGRSERAPARARRGGADSRSRAKAKAKGEARVQGGARAQGQAEGRGRGRPRVDDKPRRILDAALRVFAARGYDGTSVPEVARAAGVAIGSLYHYFEDKEALVNEVYRDAKLRLRAALLDDLPGLDVYRLDEAERWFAELWRRLAAFAAAEPDAFRFLEMQDHAPYLDARSKQVELSVLAPLVLAGQRLRHGVAGAPIDVLIALLWGAFVGLVKASRLGYLRLDDDSLEHARQACWRMIAPGKRLRPKG